MTVCGCKLFALGPLHAGQNTCSRAALETASQTHYQKMPLRRNGLLRRP